MPKHKRRTVGEVEKEIARIPCYIRRPLLPSTTGFVFICPGRLEENAGYPCAGQTGQGLNAGLAQLTRLRGDLFPSRDRFDYLITNAWIHPEYRTRPGQPRPRSLPELMEVVTRQNIERLHSEILELNHVVACGELAHLAVRLCVEFLNYSGNVAYVEHTSRQALGCPTNDRYDEVIKAWAKRVIAQFDGR
jgi:hypothetical protein